MRTITLIVIHCSATREDREYSFEACRHDHIHNRRYSDIGYHYYITRDGEIHKGRDVDRIGAHCKGHNAHSIGICYEGGLDADGRPKDAPKGRNARTASRAQEELSARLHPRPSRPQSAEGVPLLRGCIRIFIYLTSIHGAAKSVPWIIVLRKCSWHSFSPFISTYLPLAMRM